MIRSIYYFLVVTITSASFSGAVMSTLWVLLFLFSLATCLKHLHQLFFSTQGNLGYALTLWLIFCALINSQNSEGLFFIIEEYRVLWMAPTIAYALSRSLSRKEILLPLAVGSLFNVLGSGLLTLDHFVNDNLFSECCGVVSKGTAFTLNGKFTQSFVVFFWLSTYLTFMAIDRKLTPAKKVLLAIILGLILIHGVNLAGSRTLLIGSIIISIVIATICTTSRTRLVNIIIYSILLISFTYIMFKLELLNVGTLERDLTLITENKWKGSLGSRIMSLTNIFGLPLNDLLFGVSDWRQQMKSWYDAGTLSHHILRWQDFHSEFVWLIVLGGIVAVYIYLLLVYSIFVASVMLIANRNDLFAGSIGIAISVIMVPVGLLNSIFLAFLESHFIGLAFVIWLALIRLNTSVIPNRVV